MLGGAVLALLARGRRVRNQETPPPKGMTWEQVRIMDKWLHQPRPRH